VRTGLRVRCGPGDFPVRLSIQKPLALRAAQKVVSALRIRDVAAVVPEIEFREVAVQMGFADMVEVAIDAALHREERLDRVGMVKPASANILVSRVVDGAVTGELPT